MKTDGSVTCWGDNEKGQATAPEGEFTSVSGGLYHTCGLRQDGSIVCWGDNEIGQTSAPGGEFTSVSAGS